MISVLVANYNYGNYLGRCIRSILEQTLENDYYEVIVVDDGSTDESVELLKLFGDSISLVALPKNVGLASAINHGLRIAKGRYIVRVDSDDYVHPEFLRSLQLYMELKADLFDAVAADYYKVDEIGNKLALYNASLDPIACGILFKFEALGRIGFYKEGLRFGEDQELREKFINAGMRIGHLPLPLYRYTKHGDSLTDKNLLT